MIGQQTIHTRRGAQDMPTDGRNLPNRRMPVGAEVVEGGAHFRVWAPRSRAAAVQLISDANGGTEIVPLKQEKDGYFSGFVPEARTGTLYKFQLDSGAFPDPVSRFQPEGPHGPSQIVDPASYAWRDINWQGVSRAGQGLFE